MLCAAQSSQCYRLSATYSRSRKMSHIVLSRLVSVVHSGISVLTLSPLYLIERLTFIIYRIT